MNNATTPRQKNRRAVKQTIFGLLVLAGTAAVIYAVTFVASADSTLPEPITVEAVEEKGQSDCVEFKPGQFDCTSDEIKVRLYDEQRDGGIEWYDNRNIRNVTASITMYSRRDSCHYPRGNECLTAIGRDTKEGVTIACPHNYPLGTTKVVINGHTYTCEDRTAHWVQNKFGDTFDIFTEDYNQAVQFGRQNLEVIIHL